MIIRKVLKKSSLVMTALTLGMSAISMNVSASASDTLDNLTANATFNYTGGDGKKLSQIGRHAYTFGRIRFSNPTTAVNLVNLTAPSISPPNCNSININLGSFDIISLDEAVSILRRIASEALTYGFGLALQSMCSPCWTAMKTLQTQLERLNLANRNTCTMVKSFIDEKTDNGQLFNVFGDMCKGSSDTTGDDPYICQLGDASKSSFIGDAWSKLITAIEANGGDADRTFLYGNVTAEAFQKAQSAAAIPDSVFPSVISTFLLGTPTVDPTNNIPQPGISVTEASMNLFGYWGQGPDDAGDEVIKQKYQRPTVTHLGTLLTNRISGCDGEDCRKIMQCQDTSITGSDGVAHDLNCGTVSYTAPDYSALKTEYEAIDLCSDLDENPNIPEVLRCLVHAGYAHLANGTPENLTPLQQKIIQASPVSVIRVMSLGNVQERNEMLGLMSTHLSEYLANQFLYNYVEDLGQLTKRLLDKGQEELDIKESMLVDTRQEIETKVNQAMQFKVYADMHLAELQKTTTYIELTKKYATSMSAKMSGIANKSKS